MQDNNKKANQSFLDKFKGRANRVDKNGLNHALDPIKNPSSPKNDNQLPPRRKRLASLEHSTNTHDQQLSRVDLDQIIPSNPASKQHYIPKRSANTTKITPKKLEYVPSLYDPQKTSGMLSSNLDSSGLHMPPSRSISDKSQNLHKRAFGKYLKLDNEAMKHLQFLQQLNKNRVKKNSNIVQ